MNRMESQHNMNDETDIRIKMGANRNTTSFETPEIVDKNPSNCMDEVEDKTF